VSFHSSLEAEIYIADITSISVEPPILELGRPTFSVSDYYVNGGYIHTYVKLALPYSVVAGTEPGYYSCLIRFSSDSHPQVLEVAKSLLVVESAERASGFNLGGLLLFADFFFCALILSRLESDTGEAFKIKGAGKLSIAMIFVAVCVLLYGLFLCIKAVA
jgi:hypothetical protein